MSSAKHEVFSIRPVNKTLALRIKNPFKGVSKVSIAGKSLINFTLVYSWCVKHGAGYFPPEYTGMDIIAQTSKQNGDEQSEKREREREK